MTSPSIPPGPPELGFGRGRKLSLKFGPAAGSPFVAPPAAEAHHDLDGCGLNGRK